MRPLSDDKLLNSLGKQVEGFREFQLSFEDSVVDLQSVAALEGREARVHL